MIARPRLIPVLWVVAFVVTWRLMVFGPLEVLVRWFDDTAPEALLYAVAFVAVAAGVSISVALACRFGAIARWIRITFVVMSAIQMISLSILLALEASRQPSSEMIGALGTAALWSSMGIVAAAVAFAFSRGGSSFEQAHRAERQKVD